MRYASLAILIVSYCASPTPEWSQHRAQELLLVFSCVRQSDILQCGGGLRHE